MPHDLALQTPIGSGRAVAVKLDDAALSEPPGESGRDVAGGETDPSLRDERTRSGARKALPFVAAFVAIILLLPQVGQASATIDAITRADWRWLPAVAAASAVSYLLAAVALVGASRQQLEFGRTWAVQVASAFTNRCLPAGLGGMATNVRYLERAGTSRPDAVAAVAATSAAGFVVHLVGVLTVAAFLRTNRVRLHL